MTSGTKSRLVMATESDWAVLAAREEERTSIREGFLEYLQPQEVDELMAGNPVDVDFEPTPEQNRQLIKLLARNQRLLRASQGVL